MGFHGIGNACLPLPFTCAPPAPCRALPWVVTAPCPLCPLCGRGWGCTRCSPLFSQRWMSSFTNSLVVSLTFPCTTPTALMFSHPRSRSGNKIWFSQEMASLAYLNENAVVCCFTQHCEHPDQRINTRLKIRSSSASKPCSLCLWYANKESLNKFDSIKLIRGFKCRLSCH